MRVRVRARILSIQVTVLHVRHGRYRRDPYRRSYNTWYVPPSVGFAKLLAEKQAGFERTQSNVKAQ